MTSAAALDRELEALGCELARAPPVALFLAGKAFHRYRTAGGVRTGVLPHFFIGAHARVEGRVLLTRDPTRFRTYFPDVELMAPA